MPTCSQNVGSGSSSAVVLVGLLGALGVAVDGCAVVVGLVVGVLVVLVVVHGVELAIVDPVVVADVPGRDGVGVLPRGQLVGLLLGRRERRHVDPRGRHQVVEGVDHVVPALGDRVDELLPQLPALAADERQRALVQQGEAGRGVEDLLDDLEVAHLGDRPDHADDLGQLADGPLVGVLGGQLGDADHVVAVGLLGRQLRDRQVRHHRPRGVVAEVVRVVGADERGQLGHLREGEQGVVVAEEGLPVLAVLPPPRRPERDEVALGERELDGDDVAGHGRQRRTRLLSGRRGATRS